MGSRCGRGHDANSLFEQIAVGMPAVIASFVISTLAHFAVGAAKSLVTTRSWWASGLEMTIVGVIEAAITYGLGVALAGHTVRP